MEACSTDLYHLNIFKPIYSNLLKRFDVAPARLQLRKAFLKPVAMPRIWSGFIGGPKPTDSPKVRENYLWIGCILGAKYLLTSLPHRGQKVETVNICTSKIYKPPKRNPGASRKFLQTSTNQVLKCQQTSKPEEKIR